MQPHRVLTPIHFHIRADEVGKAVVGELSEKSVFLVPR